MTTRDCFLLHVPNPKMYKICDCLQQKVKRRNWSRGHKSRKIWMLRSNGDHCWSVGQTEVLPPRRGTALESTVDLVLLSIKQIHNYISNVLANLRVTQGLVCPSCPAPTKPQAIRFFLQWELNWIFWMILKLCSILNHICEIVVLDEKGSKQTWYVTLAVLV